MGRRKITRKPAAERKADICKLLGRKPSKTTEIAKALKLNASTVSTFLNEMIEEGTVDYAGEGGRSDPYVFSLVNKPNGTRPTKPKRTNGNGTAIAKRETTAVIVETLRVTADQLSDDEVVFGACALALRKAGKRGKVTLKADSPVMGLLAYAVDAHIAQSET